MSVLEVIGLIFLILMGFLGVVSVAVFFWLRSKFRSWGRVLEEMKEQASRDAAEQSLELHLGPPVTHEWLNAEQLDETTRFLEANGFVRGGDHRVAELRGVFVRCWARPDGAMAIYHEMEPQEWLDLVAETPDGRILTVSNTAEPPLFSPTEGKIDVRLPGVAAEQLLQAFESELPGLGRLELVEPADVPRRIEEFFAREQLIRDLQGGPTNDEIRQYLNQKNEEVTAERVDQIRQNLRSTANNRLTQRCLGQFLCLPEAARLGDMAPEVCIVHGNNTNVESGELFGSRLDEEPEASTDAIAENDDDDSIDDPTVMLLNRHGIDPLGGDGITTFRRLNDARKTRGLPAYTLVTTLSKPLVADVWLPPSTLKP